VFESTAAIYNDKIVDTGPKDLPLIHMYMNSNLMFDCIRIKTKVYSLLANSIKYMSYFHKDKIRICLRYFGRTQFASRDCLSWRINSIFI
jgi:hypothetical protein